MKIFLNLILSVMITSSLLISASIFADHNHSSSAKTMHHHDLSDSIKKAVMNSDRPEKDMARDKDRKPAEVMKF